MPQPDVSTIGAKTRSRPFVEHLFAHCKLPPRQFIRAHVEIEGNGTLLELIAVVNDDLIEPPHRAKIDNYPLWPFAIRVKTQVGSIPIDE